MSRCALQPIRGFDGERRELSQCGIFLKWHLELEWTHLTDKEIGIWYFLEALFIDCMLALTYSKSKKLSLG